MKFLLVHNYYQLPGGEDEVYKHERDLLLRHGHEVIEYVRDNREIASYRTSQKLGLAVRTTWAWDSYYEISSLIKENRIDLVHFHNTFPLISPAAYYACKSHRVPVVQTLHNYRFACPSGDFLRDGKPCEDCINKSLLRAIQYSCYRNSRSETGIAALSLALHHRFGTYRRIERFVTASEFTRRKLAEAGLPIERIRVKPNFLGHDPGMRTVDQGYVIFVGRLSAEKGLMLLLDSWKQYANIPLHIVGDGPLKNALQNQALTFKLIHTVFTGRLERAQVVAQIKGAQFLIFPSLCYETFGMSIIEAYACGVPVVASKGGAIEELVDDGQTGVLFSAGDVNDLTTKVQWAWTHPEEMRMMGLKARAKYEREYTAPRNYETLMDIYKEAINMKDRGIIHTSSAMASS